MRSFNRQWNRDLALKPCEICGYNKHINLCHIKDIASFSDDATLGEVNSPDNIRVMCKNHHWEFDNDMLDE